MARKVILDVDTGSDDAVAIMLATLHPAIDLRACTTVWGNLTVDKTTANTLAILGHLGRSDIPVYRGLAGPYAPVPYTPEEEVQGFRGFDRESIHGIRPAQTSAEARPETAVEFLVETLRSVTEPITLVPVGPLTNIAAAITADPKIVEMVEELVIMGGAHALGNVTPSAEYNIWHDPVAADVVFTAGFERLVLVPLDATHEAVISRAENARLEARGSHAAKLAAELIGQRFQWPADPLEAGQVMDTTTVHDALCIAYLIDPSVLNLGHYHVAVETCGRHTFGRTVVDVSRAGKGRPNAWVALSANRIRFFELLEDTFAGSDIS